MIKNIRHRGLKWLYEDDDRRGLPVDMVGRIRTILAALDDARVSDDMSRPGFRLHALKGDVKGFWAVTVRANWRIIFRFEDGDALDVDFIDYH
ncbi:MAG: type II toxin-antitoxin system RelE/ParE family toxin [Alphaproteobacteria bacterium]|nr:type II toxin-antitoxin system RelE/ParE family toxin [Alphaproteobacteria bacterium]